MELSSLKNLGPRPIQPNIKLIGQLVGARRHFSQSLVEQPLVRELANFRKLMSKGVHGTRGVNLPLLFDAILQEFEVESIARWAVSDCNQFILSFFLSFSRSLRSTRPSIAGPAPSR